VILPVVALTGMGTTAADTWPYYALRGIRRCAIATRMTCDR